MNKSIKWLFIVPQDRLLGGAEQLIMNLVIHLVEIGETCCIVFLKKKIYKDWEHLEDVCEIKYSAFSNIYLGYLSLIPRLIHLSLNNPIEHSFTTQTLINAMMGFHKKIGFFRNTSVIVRESNSIFHLLKGNKLRLYKLAYRLGYSQVDHIICQTEFMKNQLVEALPWMGQKHDIKVLSNPIDLKTIEIKAKATLPPELEDRKFVVAAGRLVPAKGFDLLIKAYSSLQSEFPELDLFILGQGPEEENLKMLISELKLDDRVHLPGYIQNVYPYFKSASICVLSSRIEGFPNVLLQMMSQNNKVVSTLSADGIEKLKGVFTCQSNDIDDLTFAMRTCYLTDTTNYNHYFMKELESRTVKGFYNSILALSY